MKYFKNFTQICMGFAAFTALISLFRKFMSIPVPVGEEVGMLERIKQFISPESSIENALLLLLALMLSVSVIASCLLCRLPYITLLFSLPPVVLAVDMIKANFIKDYPMLMLLLCALGFIGGVYECMRMDREDGGFRAQLGGTAVGVMLAAVLLKIYLRHGELRELPSDTDEVLNFFDLEIAENAAEMNMGIFLVLAASYLLLSAIGLVLRDIYFIDLALAVVPTVAVVYLWGAGKLTVHPEIIAVFAFAFLCTRIMPTFYPSSNKNSKTAVF